MTVAKFQKLLKASTTDPCSVKLWIKRLRNMNTPDDSFWRHETFIGVEFDSGEFGAHSMWELDNVPISALHVECPIPIEERNAGAAGRLRDEITTFYGGRG